MITQIIWIYVQTESVFRDYIEHNWKIRILSVNGNHKISDVIGKSQLFPDFLFSRIYPKTETGNYILVFIFDIIKYEIIISLISFWIFHVIGHALSYKLSIIHTFSDVKIQSHTICNNMIYINSLLGFGYMLCNFPTQIIL